MTLSIDYKEAVELRNAGVTALINNLGEEKTAKFISLFSYYTAISESNFPSMGGSRKRVVTV